MPTTQHQSTDRQICMNIRSMSSNNHPVCRYFMARRHSWAWLTAWLFAFGPATPLLAQQSLPLPAGSQEHLRRIVAQSALSNCYLLRAGVDSKAAFRANTAAAISHLKDSTANGFSSIAPGSMPKLSRVLSLQIAAASVKICPDEVPTDVKTLVNNIKTKLNSNAGQ